MKKLNLKAITLIQKSDKAFPHDKEEKDLKDYIDKQKAYLNKAAVVKAVNQLHVKDPEMGKKDLERNMKIIEENEHMLKDSNGFELIEEKTGISKEKL